METAKRRVHALPYPPDVDAIFSALDRLGARVVELPDAELEDLVLLERARRSTRTLWARAEWTDPECERPQKNDGPGKDEESSIPAGSVNAELAPGARAGGGRHRLESVARPSDARSPEDGRAKSWSRQRDLNTRPADYESSRRPSSEERAAHIALSLAAGSEGEGCAYGLLAGAVYELSRGHADGALWRLEKAIESLKERGHA